MILLLRGRRFTELMLNWLSFLTKTQMCAPQSKTSYQMQALWKRFVHLHIALTPEWYHVAYQPTGNSNACLTAWSRWIQRNYQSSGLLMFCGGKAHSTSGFPSQRASGVDSVSMSWRRDVYLVQESRVGLEEAGTADADLPWVTMDVEDISSWSNWDHIITQLTLEWEKWYDQLL